MKKILIITLMTTLILLYDKVDALSFSTDVKQVGDTYLDWSNINNQNDWTATDSGYTSRIQTNSNSQVQNKYIELIKKLDTTSVDFVAIPFMSSQPIRNLTSNTQNFVRCIEWGREDNGDYYCMDGDIDSSNLNMPYTTNLTEMNFYFTVTYYDDNNNWNGWNSCDYSDGMILCPTIHKKIKYIYVHYNFNAPETTYSTIFIGGGLRFYNYNDTTQAIHEQTQQQQQQHDQFMNSNQTYTDEQDTNMRGVNETMEFEQAESQLIENLDMNTSIVDEIIINPEASVFIWKIVEVLRSMNPAIILLMGSMLGMGILKLVLNR